MRRFAVTCDDCPDWRETHTTETIANRAASLHQAREHADSLLDDMDAFIAAHIPLAHFHAHKAGRVGMESYADVYADALVGLWDAARRWDPTRGKFPTFAACRIAGQITDGRRERDPLSRTQRQQGDIPRPVSLEATLGNTDMQRADLISDTADPIGDWLDWHDGVEQGLHERLMTAIDTLPPRNAYVIGELLAGRTLAAIGADLDVTESRACQIKHDAIHRLRKQLVAA